MVPAVRSGPLPYAKTAPMTQCSMGAVWAVMHVCCTYFRYSHSTAPKMLVFKLK